jgi:hypothetical protein
MITCNAPGSESKIDQENDDGFYTHTGSFYCGSLPVVQNPFFLVTQSLGRRGDGSQNPQRPLFHLLGLCRGFVKARLKVSPAMFPSHLNGGSPIVSLGELWQRAN